MSSTRRNQSLDVLRGVAIALVMLRHAFPAQFPGAGIVGVVIFFTLSGYLITGLLRDELATSNRIDFGRFYRRRLIRLGPALLAVVAAMTVVTVLFDPLDDKSTLARTIAVALTWTGDLPISGTSAAAFHLWTLALEEQFYLVWPLAILLLHRSDHLRLGIYVAVAGCWLAALLTTVWLIEEPDLGYSLPTSWAVAMAAGAAFQLASRQRVRRTWALAATAVLLGTCLMDLRGHAYTYVIVGPTIAGLTGVLLLWSRRHEQLQWPPARILEWLGNRSYAAYLWNYPLTLWIDAHSGTVRALIATVLTLVAADLSYRLIERPAQMAWAGSRARQREEQQCAA